MSKFFRTIAGIAAPLAAVLCLGLISPASAAPLQISRDQADNGYSFSYDAAAAEMSQEASSILLGRRDQVRFITSVKPGAEGLVGSVALTSKADRRVIYDGTFIFKVAPVEGGATVVKVPARIVLKPGQLSAKVRFPFEVPSGDYSVYARFNG